MSTHTKEYRVKKTLILVTYALYIISTINSQGWTQDEPRPELVPSVSKTTTQANEANSQANSNDLESNALTLTLSLTLYPQQELIEIEPGMSISEAWEEVYPLLSKHLQAQELNLAVETFTTWKRTQQSTLGWVNFEPKLLELYQILNTLNEEFDEDQLHHSSLSESQILLTKLKNQAVIFQEGYWEELESNISKSEKIFEELSTQEEQFKQQVESLIRLAMYQLNLPDSQESELGETRRMVAQLSVLSSLNIQRHELFIQTLDSFELMKQDSTKLRVQFPQLKLSQQRKIDHIGRWIDYLKIRERLERTYQDSSLEHLMSQQSLLSRVLDERREGLTEEDNQLELERDQLIKDKQEALNKLKLPSATQEEDQRITQKKPLTARSKLKNVEHTYQLTQDILAFRQARLSLLIDATERGKSLTERIVKLRERFTQISEKVIERDILQELILKHQAPPIPSVSSLEILSRERSSFLDMLDILARQEDWENGELKFNQQLDEWRELIKEDQSSEAQLSDELTRKGGLKDQLDTERAWIEFLSEVERLDGPALLTKHQEGVSQFEHQSQRVNQLYQQHEQLLAECIRLSQAREQLRDPLLRQYPSDHQEFEKYIKELSSLIKEDVTPDGNTNSNTQNSSKDIKSRQAVMSTLGALSRLTQKSEPTIANIEEILQNKNTQKLQKSKLLALLTVANQLKTLLLPRIAYYLELSRIKYHIKRSLEQQTDLLKTIQLELSRKVDLARQVRRTATVIRQRVLEGELESSVMTEQLETYGQRDWVDQLRAEHIDILKLQLEFHQQREALEPTFDEIAKLLINWRDILSEMIELGKRQLLSMEHIQDLIRYQGDETSNDQNKVSLIQSPSLMVNTDSTDTSDQQPTSAQENMTKEESTLSKLDKRHFMHQLHQRMKRDLPWYEPLWRSFHDNHSDEIDMLLYEQYVELIHLETKQIALKEHMKSTTELNKLVNSLQPLLSNYRVQLQELIQNFRSRLEYHKATWVLRSSSADLETKTTPNELPEQRFAELSLRVLKPFENAVAQQVELQKLEDDWMAVHSYQLVIAELDQSMRPQGIFGYIQGEINDLTSMLETELRELNRPLDRLLGGEHLRKNLEQAGDELNYDPTVGEIEQLHVKRREAKLQVFLWSVLKFLLIPLFTLLSLRFVGSVERRIRTRAEQDIERLLADGEIVTRQKRAEREDRMMTLLQVFRTVAKVLIWSIAIGAMLKALYIDVTPILASAGIIGLAFAFGAQELVRDFFAGIFILFENQYNRGDFVTINGIFGYIDRVTLRLTVIRDSHGVVHFIPNGHVQHVSNHNKDWSQAHLEIGASYNDPPQKVLDCLRTVCKDVSDDPVIGPDMLGWEVLGLERFDDSAVIYRVHLKTEPKEQWRVARHFRRRVMEIFAEVGIEIPFPQITINYPDSSASENEPTGNRLEKF